MNHQTPLQQYATLRRILAYQLSGQSCYAACDIQTRYDITLMIPKLAKVCRDSALHSLAHHMAKSAKRNGV